MNNDKNNPAEKAYNDAVFLHENGEVRKAIAAYTKVLQTFGGSTNPDVQEATAMALVNKADCLADLGDSKEAIASWDEVTRRFGKVSHPPVRRQVAMSMVNKAIYLWENDQSPEAIAICDEVVSIYEDDGQVAKPVADALYNKGGWLGMAGRWDESLETSSLVIQRFGASPDPEVQTIVDQALNNRLFALTQSEPTGRAKKAGDMADDASRLGSDPKSQKQALKIRQRIIDEFSDQTHSAIRSQVAGAMTSILIKMQEEGKRDKAIQACKFLVQKFETDEEPLIRLRVALALIWTAGMYKELEHDEAAISAYSQIGDLFGNDKFPTLVRQAVIEAEQSKISLLNELELYERGINACDTILHRHPENPVDPALNVHIRWVMSEKAFQLMEERKFEEAIAVFVEVERRGFTSQNNASDRRALALLLRNKAGCLRALGRHGEALRVDGSLKLAFGNDPEPSVRWHAEHPLYLSDDEDDEDELSNLIDAAGEGRLELVRELLENGADIEAKTETNETALMEAVGPGNTEVVRLLLERGARVDAKDDDGDTSLMRAAYHGRLKIVRLLLEYGADINHRDDAGDTALIWAAWKNHPQVVRLLLEHGAEVSIKNAAGQTALSITQNEEIKLILGAKNV